MFSLLCRVLKGEIKSPDELIKKIQQAPIIPKPEVRELLYTWDWRLFVQPKLSDRDLKNHSFFHSFNLKKEKAGVLFRAKKYSQDKQWGPIGGLKLLKDGFMTSPVPASEFRVESLNLDRVYSDLYSKYFPTLEVLERKDAEASWEKLRTVLESLPRRQKNLPPLQLLSFPKQTPGPRLEVPGYLDQFMVEDIPELTGENCILEPTDGKFETDIVNGMDVAVYTSTVSSRPWVGRVLSLLENGRFLVNWFKRKGRSSTYQALYNKDGTRYTSVLLLETVMLWEFSENKTLETFDISRQWLEKIYDEYSSHDLCYK